MIKRLSRTVIVAVLAMLVASAAPAGASYLDVIRDCSEDGVLDKSYSQKELSKALDKLPSDLDEYTDCRTVIRDAQLGGHKHAGTKGGQGLGVDSKTPPSPEEQQKLKEASKNPSPVKIGGKSVTPGFRASALGSDLPGYVLAALIALGAATLAGGAFASQRRWPGPWRVAGARVGPPIRRLENGIRRGIARIRR
jgi:hypothetical protein